MIVADKFIKSIGLDKHHIESIKWSHQCKINKASNKILLGRFYKEKKIKIPFLNNYENKIVEILFGFV